MSEGRAALCGVCSASASAPVRAGQIDYEELSPDQRGAVLQALECAMLDTSFMRLTVADTLDSRREATQELNALRTRLRKCVACGGIGTPSWQHAPGP